MPVYLLVHMTAPLEPGDMSPLSSLLIVPSHQLFSVEPPEYTILILLGVVRPKYLFVLLLLLLPRMPITLICSQSNFDRLFIAGSTSVINPWHFLS